MLKYVAVGLCLKGFSANAISRRLYRRLGNSVGGDRRATEAMPAYYPERIRRMLRLVKQHKIVRDGDRILELGTGWLHWEALTLRLFFDIESVLFDVWDNRQLGGLKNYVGQLRSSLNNGFDLSKAQLSRANSLIDAILDAPSFAELYELLGFTYAVEDAGDLSQFPDEHFDLVVSAGVLEHVTRETVPPLITETYRLLKPGGWASHSIDTSDHLAHYDTGVSKKMYLTFSEKTWKRLFENRVQYINRIPRSRWLELFRSSSFMLIDEQSNRIDISDLKLAEPYRDADRGDLECTYLRVILRKPIPVNRAPAVGNAYGVENM